MPKQLHGQYFLSCWLILSVVSKSRREAAMTQWWEHSPPNNVARVRSRPGAICVSWVCCWVSPYLEGSSPGSPVYLPPQKKSLNSNSTRIEDPHKNQLRLLGQIWCIAVKLGTYENRRKEAGRFPIHACMHEEDSKNKVSHQQIRENTDWTEWAMRSDVEDGAELVI